MLKSWAEMSYEWAELLGYDWAGISVKYVGEWAGEKGQGEGVLIKGTDGPVAAAMASQDCCCR